VRVIARLTTPSADRDKCVCESRGSNEADTFKITHSQMLTATKGRKDNRYTGHGQSAPADNQPPRKHHTLLQRPAGM
jgi:hypothetical protein